MLTEEAKNVLEKPRWTDPIDLFIGDIIEYDMKEGGFSIIREENLLPTNEIEKLKAIPDKHERDITIGKLKYSKNPDIRNTGKKLEMLFTKYRLMFGSANDLQVDDIFSVKRDAIFIKRYAPHTEFGNYINFREKHAYDIYILLGQDELVTNLKSRHKTYEVYFNSYTDDIAIKGIKDEQLLKYHMDGIISIIKRYLRYLVKFDYEGATKFMVKTIDDYKFFRLPISVYRDFNDVSSYRLQMDGKEFEVDEADMSIKEILDIRYNFNHILVPMLNMASLGVATTRSKNTR